MQILALNFGSSSIKYQLFDMSRERLVKKGKAEKIGPADYRVAFLGLLGELEGQKVDAIGHRIVHGGEQLRQPTLINAEVMQQIREAGRFAPLHSQPNILGIEMSQELLPGLPHVAIFDTGIYATMEAKAYLYGISLEYYQKYGIRRYGFHGINHGYVAQEAAKLLAQPLDRLKIVTCHLGNGCSISAFEQGKSIDNSMGMTPLEGVVMGTRSGDLDPSVVLYLLEVLKLKPAQVNELLNKQSGLLGLCGKSDMRDIIADAQQGNPNAQQAIDLFVYRIQKAIGGLVAALNGVDAIVFTGGIGENSPYIRARIVQNLGYLGAKLDQKANEANAALFSSPEADVILLTIPANEELVIARQTVQVLNSR